MLDMKNVFCFISHGEATCILFLIEVFSCHIWVSVSHLTKGKSDTEQKCTQLLLWYGFSCTFTWGASINDVYKISAIFDPPPPFVCFLSSFG